MPKRLLDYKNYDVHCTTTSTRKQLNATNEGDHKLFVCERLEPVVLHLEKTGMTHDF